MHRFVSVLKPSKSPYQVRILRSASIANIGNIRDIIGAAFQVVYGGVLGAHLQGSRG